MENRRIGFEIRSLSNLIKRDVERSHAEHCIDNITSLHGWIIGYIYRKGDTPVFQRDLERHFSVRRSTMSNIIDLMQKNGLIERHSFEGDARLKRLVLTNKADCVHNFILSDIERLEAMLSEGLSNEEITAFLNTAEKIRANIERKNSDD